MRHFTIITIAFLLTLSQTSISAEHPTNLIEKLQSTYQQANNWEADFTQSTFVELLGKKIHKNGRILIKKPGKLRIEYQNKLSKFYISNGKKLWIYTEGDSQVQVFKKISKILAKEALSFLQGLAHLEEEFTVKSYRVVKNDGTMMLNKNLSFLELVPKQSASVIEKIIIGMDRKTNMVTETTLFNTSGNRTHYVFKDIRLNTELPETLFEFKKRKGVREVKG